MGDKKEYFEDDITGEEIESIAHEMGIPFSDWFLLDQESDFKELLAVAKTIFLKDKCNCDE